MSWFGIAFELLPPNLFRWSRGKSQLARVGRACGALPVIYKVDQPAARVTVLNVSLRSDA
jgi:hypothetical protein